MTKENYDMPTIQVINALNIEQYCSTILEQINTSSFVCIHLQATDCIQLANIDNHDLFYEHYCLLKRAVNQSGIMSIALSIGSIDEEINVTRVVHYQIATCPYTDHNEHPYLLQHLITKGYNLKEAPFAIRYFPSKPSIKHSKFVYPKQHDCLFLIMNSLLRPPHYRRMFIWDGLVTLMLIYRHFHTHLPNSPQEFLVDVLDMYGMSIIDILHFSHLNNYLPLLDYISIAYGVNTTSVSVPATQEWPKYTSIYEDQIIASKNKQIEPKGVNNVCLKYFECGYCLLEGACPYSHTLEDIITYNTGLDVKKCNGSVGKTWKVPTRFRTWHLEGIWLTNLIKVAAPVMASNINECFSFGNHTISIVPNTTILKSELHELRMNALFGDVITFRAKKPRKSFKNKRYKPSRE